MYHNISSVQCFVVCHNLRAEIDFLLGSPGKPIPGFTQLKVQYRFPGKAAEPRILDDMDLPGSEKQPPEPQAITNAKEMKPEFMPGTPSSVLGRSHMTCVDCSDRFKVFNFFNVSSCEDFHNLNVHYFGAFLDRAMLDWTQSLISKGFCQARSSSYCCCLHISMLWKF